MTSPFRELVRVLVLPLMALSARAETTLARCDLVQMSQTGPQSTAARAEPPCPPEGSVVAYIDREGTEQRRYGRFLDELLLPAIRSRGTDPAAMPEYLAMITGFAQTLQAEGLNVYAGDIIVHEQTLLKSLLSDGPPQPGLRARWELRLAVMNQLRLRLCSQ